jgi:hypothetical protein
VVIRHLETALHSPSPNSSFRRPEGRLLNLWTICLLKTSLKRIRTSRFVDAQDDFAWPFVTFKCRFTKVFFKTSRRQFLSSQGHSPI